MLKLLFASIIDYNLGLFIIKASLLYQYLRFFVQRQWRTACHIIMAIVISGGAAFILASIMTCNPVAKFWNDSLEGSCVNKQG